MPSPYRRLTALEASEACVAALIEEGPELTVADLADRVGISRRTFHRYFSSREASIVPLLDAGLRTFVAEFDARPAGESVEESLVAAFDIAGGGPLESRTIGLMSLLSSSAALRAVIAQAVEDVEVLLAPPIARRLGIAADDFRGRTVAAVASHFLRRAIVDAGAEHPTTLLRQRLAQVDLRAFVRLPLTRESHATMSGPSSAAG